MSRKRNTYKKRPILATFYVDNDKQKVYMRSSSSNRGLGKSVNLFMRSCLFGTVVLLPILMFSIIGTATGLVDGGSKIAGIVVSFVFLDTVAIVMFLVQRIRGIKARDEEILLWDGKYLTYKWRQIKERTEQMGQHLPGAYRVVMIDFDNSTISYNMYDYEYVFKGAIKASSYTEKSAFDNNVYWDKMFPLTESYFCIPDYFEPAFGLFIKQYLPHDALFH